MADRIVVDDAVIRRAIAAGATGICDDDGNVIALTNLSNIPRSKLSLADRTHILQLIKQGDDDHIASGGQIIRDPNPGGLLDGGKTYVMRELIESGNVDRAIKSFQFAGAVDRVEKLRKHPELASVADELMTRAPRGDTRPALNDDAGWAALLSDPFWHDLARAEILALAYSVAPRVERDRKRQSAAIRGARKGGRATALAVEEWHRRAVKLARDLIEKGTPPRSVAGIISRRLGKSARAIRDVLKKAELA